MRTNKRLTIKLIILIVLFLLVSMVAISYSGLISLKTSDAKLKTFVGVEKIVVYSTNLSVDIYESDVKQVTIKDQSKVSGLGTKKIVQMNQNEEVIIIKQSKKNFFLTSVRGNIVVEVPKNSGLEYDVKTISGDIDHDASSEDRVKATSISGEVEIKKTGEKLVVETTSGTVQIDSPFEEIKVKSVSGSILARANQDSKKLALSTVSGSIKIQLKEVLDYNVNYLTTSGSIKSTYKNGDYSKLEKSKKRDNQLEIDASSISGSIKLMNWND